MIAYRTILHQGCFTDKMFRLLKLFLVLFCIPARGFSQDIVDEQGFWQRISNVQNDTLVVVNFWATWCKPCLEEMPYFIKASEQFQYTPVKIIFVSMDFKSQHERVKEYAQKKGISSQVMHLLPSSANDFISSVDAEWSGAIPATVYYRNSKKIYFYEGEYSEEHLLNQIKKLLKP